MTGQLYTDQEAPAHLRGAAQGFILFLTYGVGMFLGSLLSGVTVDAFTTYRRRERHSRLEGVLDHVRLGRVCDFPAGGDCVQIEGQDSSTAGSRRGWRLVHQSFVINQRLANVSHAPTSPDSNPLMNHC